MPENNFIYQDNYILSNLDAQKLYAQSPLTTGVSGSSAYIGIEPSARYNETVLWESDNPVQITTANPLTAVLTEDMNNFEYLKLLFTNSYGPGTISGMALPNCPSYAELPVINGMVCNVKLDKGEYQMFGGDYMFNDLNACYGSGTNFYVVGDGRIQMNLSGNRTAKRSDRGITPLKIIGINRKEV